MVECRQLGCGRQRLRCRLIFKHRHGHFLRKGRIDFGMRPFLVWGVTHKNRIYSPTRADRILPQSYRVHYVSIGFKFKDFELNPMDR